MIREHLDALRALLDGNPELRERTTAMLAGELPCPDLEEPMTERPLESVRLPGDMMARAEALIPAMQKDPELTAFGNVNKSSVVRLALHKGLTLLEEQYKPKRKK